MFGPGEGLFENKSVSRFWWLISHSNKNVYFVEPTYKIKSYVLVVFISDRKVCNQIEVSKCNHLSEPSHHGWIIFNKLKIILSFVIALYYKQITL